ncbi:MAG: TetR/AcrR family transcriptional regulator [Rubrimonas sp.]
MGEIADREGDDGQGAARRADPTASSVRERRPRDAEATRRRILEAAKREFAERGLGGARVDAIAERADTNKRMIYHYFGGKEALFRAVLEFVYLDIRAAERALPLEQLAPEDALRALVRFTWSYHLNNPAFLTLVNSENLHGARHLRALPRVRDAYPPMVARLQAVLDRGAEQGVFRPGVDPVQLNITISSLSHYYFSNRHTLSTVFATDLMAPQALADRLAFNIDTILRMVRA